MKTAFNKTLKEWRIIYHSIHSTEKEKRIAWCVISNWEEDK